MTPLRKHSLNIIVGSHLQIYKYTIEFFFHTKIMLLFHIYLAG